MTAWTRRLAAAADDRAMTEDDPVRKANLVEVARVCCKIADAKPDTFREAVQWIAVFNMASRTYNRDGAGGTAADRWAVKLTEMLNGEIANHTTPDGFKLIPGWFTWADTLRFGRTVGATPNGRKAGEPISHWANPLPGFRKDGALTGGEPAMQPEFAFALASAAHDEGMPVALDTCGFAPWAVFERMLAVVDLFLYDLKCMDAEKHRMLTGADNALILDNLRRLDAAGAKTWIRCPLVPGLNDSDSDLAALRDCTRSLRNVQKVEICPYHTLGLEKYAKFGRQVPSAVPTAPAAPADIKRWRQVCATSP